MGVVAQGTDNRDLDETRFPWVDAANPHYTNEYPINDERWSTVRIPLTDLGMKDHGDIWSFRIWTAEDPRPTPTYLDNIRVRIVRGYLTMCDLRGVSLST